MQGGPTRFYTGKGRIVYVVFRDAISRKGSISCVKYEYGRNMAWNMA